ncbi:Actin-like protein MamK [Candidatus Magnetomoraceae bacterium gMMP-1]
MSTLKVLHVGIDLGTSRTVIACDNGVRTFVPSYVGYGKDAVSSKMLGKNIVFGDEALKYRMAVDLYRPLEKGVIRYSDALENKTEDKLKAIEVAKELLKHVIELVTQEEDDEEFVIRGVIGAPALATVKNKQALLEISKEVLDDVMVVSEPFTVAYGLNLLHNALVIDIGAGTVDLCRMHGTIPTEEDQITTFKAGDYVDQVFLDLIKEKHKNANFTASMIKKFKEENAFVSSQGERVFIDLPVEGKPVSHDVTEELRQACTAIVPDIVEGVKKLVATYDPEFQNDLKGNIILAGGGSQIIGLKKEIETYMKKMLGYGKVITVEEPLYAGSNGALMLCKDMPDEYWDELSGKA